MNKFMRATLLGLLLLTLSVPILQAEVVTLRHSQGQAEMPYIIVLNNGDLLVVFNEGHSFNADADALYMIYSQETKSWSEPQIAFKKSFSSAFLQLALDSVGNVHAVMFDGNASANRDIYYTWYDVAKDKWANKVLAYESPGVNSSWPRIKIEDDLIYILWTHNYDPKIGQTDVVMITNPVGGTWPVAKDKRITVSDTGQSASVHVFFDVKDKDVYAAWIDDNHKPGNWNIYYNEGKYNDSSKTWDFNRAQQLWPSAGNQYYPALVLDDAGGVHLIYSLKNGPFFYAHKKGSSWTGPKEISTRGCSFNLLAFAKYSHGLIHTVWRQTTDNGEGLYYGRALPDGTWAEPVEVAKGQTFPGYPGLDLDAAGNVHIVWSDGDPDHPRHIYYSKLELPGKPPEAVITAVPTFGLLPLTVKFDASQSFDPDGKINDYRWSFGDGATAQGKKVEYTYKKAGDWLVTLTVIDDDLRTNTDQVTITASTGAPVAKFTVSANQGMRPLTVAFDASESEDVDGEIVSYRWDYGDGQVDEGVQVTHLYENGGDYNAKLVVTDNEGKTGTAVEVIAVFQPPVAVFTAEPTFGKPPLVVKFDASDSYDEDGEIRTYKWDFGDGLTSLSRRVNHTYGTPGTFTALLTVVDDDGYTGTTSEEIKVLDRPLAPVNVALQRFFNRSLFYMDYINEISWANHPGNSEIFTIAGYRVYRKAEGADDTQLTMVGEVSGTATSYRDRGFKNSTEADSFVYVVTALDSAGNESEYSLLVR